MKTVTLKTFEGTTITLSIVAAWISKNLYVPVFMHEPPKAICDLLHVVEANGITRTFPFDGKNKSTLELILKPSQSPSL